VTATLTAPDVTRPGSFYVPSVRVVKLAQTIQPGVEKGETLDQDILGDILQVEVTRVSSGMAQYRVTLNNWYLSTAADREHDDAIRRLSLGFIQPGGHTREAMTGTRPAWPRFKYNDFSLLAFGDRLRIDMRYMQEPVVDQNTNKQSNERAWVPMVSGPITDMRFTFGASDGARLEVSGEDDLGMLKDKSRRLVRMDGVSEVNVVRRVLKEAKYPLTEIARPLVDYPPFATDNRLGLREALDVGQPFLALIQKLAERLDFEVFLDFASLDDAESPLQFHFEPCRARSLNQRFRLDRERELLAFTPTIKVVDQYSEVRVEGRHHDPLLAEPVTGKAQREIVTDELHHPGPGPSPLKSAGEVRQKFFPGRDNRHTIKNQSNMDLARADWYAEVVIRRKARELFTIEASTLGQPRLRPGQHVEITGMRVPFDGFYYVTKVVTSYGADGLRTRLTASRPGMELP